MPRCQAGTMQPRHCRRDDPHIVSRTVAQTSSAGIPRDNNLEVEAQTQEANAVHLPDMEYITTTCSIAWTGLASWSFPAHKPGTIGGAVVHPGQTTCQERQVIQR
jgi:hypothetical protein